MLKNIINQEGVQQLNKKEQQSINGGKSECNIQCTWILNPITCKCISSGI